MIARAEHLLAGAGIERRRLDVEVLAMHLLNVDRTHLYLCLDDRPDPEIESQLLDLAERRAGGEPIAYLIGHREFMGLDFAVDPRVLIPRPETEGLVERAITWLERHPAARRVVDVGTGSGAIAISLDRHLPVDRSLSIVASDVSRDALEVAKLNRVRLRARRVNLVNGDLLNWCRDPIDLVVANLPYLREEQRHQGIGSEPDLALYANDAGFGLYARLLPQVAALLDPGGAVLCEIDPAQATRAIDVARWAFPSAGIGVERDLSGRDRYLMISWSE